MKTTLSCEVTTQIADAIKRIHATGLWGMTQAETIEHLLVRSVIMAIEGGQLSRSPVTGDGHKVQVQRQITTPHGKSIDVIEVPEIGLKHEVPGGLSDEAISRLVALFESGFTKGHASGIIFAQRKMMDAIGLPHSTT